MPLGNLFYSLLLTAVGVICYSVGKRVGLSERVPINVTEPNNYKKYHSPSIKDMNLDPVEPGEQKREVEIN